MSEPMSISWPGKNIIETQTAKSQYQLADRNNTLGKQPNVEQGRFYVRGVLVALSRGLAA